MGKEKTAAKRVTAGANATTSVRKNLPTNQIAKLLDKMGLAATWASLVATHATRSYDTQRSQLLLNDPDFASATILGVDHLEGRTLGQVSILYEFSLAHVDKDSRKESGQYFTPDDVADFMASQSVLFPSGGVWLDPCSGVGNLAYALAKQQSDPEDFVANHLYLVDRDGTALMIARGLFFLHFYRTRPDLLAILSTRMLRRDFLSKNALPTFDYALLNPPYAQVPADDRFVTAKARDLYAYFVERVTDLCRGFIAVTPQSYTHGDKFKEMRTLLLRDFPGLRLYCFDNVPDSIFHGIKFGSTNTNMANSVRACITVAREDPPERLITPLLRWSTSQRKTMFTGVHAKLSAVPLSDQVFPKNFDSLASLYSLVRGPDYVPLETLLSKTPTAWTLTVPSTPRYFAPAVLRPLSRTSFHTLYFPSQAVRDRYHLYLNSSIPYWWWRVFDGGMSFSRQTLFSVPVPKHPLQSKALTAALLKSEQANLVVKKNAGKNIENVKHKPDLLERINTFYFDQETATRLMFVHSNSYFQ